MPEIDPHLSADFAARIAALAVDGIRREYPNKIAHVMAGDAAARPPRELTPVFYGCFDWHSAVHSHWCLVRLMRCFPDAAWVRDARVAMRGNITREKAAGELRYLTGPDREGFERPYGLAWLLRLCAELREWDDADGREWLAILTPLEQLAAERFRAWLPKLSHPIRSGEHSQTAFAMGLAFDWCETAGDSGLRDVLRESALRFHVADVNAPLHFEPSGHDFLSPSLAEADLMRRMLPAAEFAGWLEAFLPTIPRAGGSGWLPVGIVTDPADGKLVHLYGLNLSRAWMLEGVAAALPAEDARIPALRAAAAIHRAAALPAVSGEHYAISHWLGSFAVYLLTRRGMSPVTSNNPS
jgi:Protein of unknown function (DUF2891)